MVVILGMALFHAVNAASIGGKEAFQQGLNAYRLGDYKQAVDYFLKANRNGKTSSILYYNLAVSYFKLSDYQQARIWFKQSAQDSKLKYLSIYNLGLLAGKMGQADQALDHFINVSENSGEAKLVRLANYQLDKMLGTPSRSGKFSGSLFVQLEYGHDTNVRGSEDTSPSKKASDYVDTYLFTAVRLAGEHEEELRLKAYILDSRYKSVPTEDLRLVSLGLEQLFLIGEWRSAVGFDYLVSTLNDKAFQDTTIFEARTKYAFTKVHEFRARYRYYDIESEAPYQELSGNKQRARFEYRANLPADKFKIFYEYESNNRSETQVSNNYSPERHTIRTAYTWSITENINLKGDLAYRRSVYSTRNSSVSRTENRRIASLGLSYYLNNNWFFAASYKQTQNDASQPQYRYQREVTSASVNMIF